MKLYNVAVSLNKSRTFSNQSIVAECMVTAESLEQAELTVEGMIKMVSWAQGDSVPEEVSGEKPQMKREGA